MPAISQAANKGNPMTRQQRKDRKALFWNVATIATFGGFISALVLGACLDAYKMINNIQQIYSPLRLRGPWSVPEWLIGQLGKREIQIMNNRRTESFPHHLNRDCDFYISDECQTFYNPDDGQFTINTKTRLIVG